MRVFRNTHFWRTGREFCNTMCGAHDGTSPSIWTRSLTNVRPIMPNWPRKASNLASPRLRLVIEKKYSSNWLLVKTSKWIPPSNIEICVRSSRVLTILFRSGSRFTLLETAALRKRRWRANHFIVYLGDSFTDGNLTCICVAPKRTRRVGRLYYWCTDQ